MATYHPQGRYALLSRMDRQSSLSWMDRPQWQETPSRLSLSDWAELAELPALEAEITDLVGDDWQDTTAWDRRD